MLALRGGETGILNAVHAISGGGELSERQQEALAPYYFNADNSTCTGGVYKKFPAFSRDSRKFKLRHTHSDYNGVLVQRLMTADMAANAPSPLDFGWWLVENLYDLSEEQIHYALVATQMGHPMEDEYVQRMIDRLREIEDSRLQKDYANLCRKEKLKQMLRWDLDKMYKSHLTKFLEDCVQEEGFSISLALMKDYFIQYCYERADNAKLSLTSQDFRSYLSLLKVVLVTQHNAWYVKGYVPPSYVRPQKPPSVSAEVKLIKRKIAYIRRKDPDTICKKDEKKLLELEEELRGMNITVEEID